MATKVVMPQLGESVVEGTVTAWLKKTGESIQELEALLEVNTDKVDTEIPSPASGIVLKILVAEGTTVKAGTLLAWIGVAGEEIPGDESGETPVQVKPDEAKPVVSPVSVNEPPLPSVNELGFISPVVAKLAAEHQVDLGLVKGSGEGGRITKKDVLSFMEKNAAEPEKAAWETPGSGDLFKPTDMVQLDSQSTAEKVIPAGSVSSQVVPLPLIRRQIAAKMVESTQQVPHVTTVMEASLQRVTAHRDANKADFERNNIRLTFSAYFFYAAAQALKAHPLVNSSWAGQAIEMHQDVHLGMAVSLGEEGLIVPVIRHVDRLSLSGMALAIQDLADRARNQKLKPEEVKGSTFSITNHGTGGSLFATPIINPPNCAILGIGSIQKRVVVVEDAIAIRPMVYLSLTFDHRILDGAAADAFLSKVVGLLENWNAN